jgi:predicted nucleic acid-binding protein
MHALGGRVGRIVDDDTLTSVVRTYFFDASAIVKHLTREPGHEQVDTLLSESGRAHSSWVVLAEVLGALKGKWRRSELTDDEYSRAVFLFFSYVRIGKFHPVDIGVRNGRPVLLTHEAEVFEHRKQYPKLDVADTLQMTAIRESFLKYFAGESQTKLVTADSDLAKAAESEKIPVVRV